MELENKLKNLSWLSNRKLEQTQLLFRLCGDDFDRLLELEARLKKYSAFATPGTKVEVDQILSLSEGKRAAETNGRDEQMESKIMEAMGLKINPKVGLYETYPSMSK